MYQKLVVGGNLGQDPELRYMPDGQAVTTTSAGVQPPLERPHHR